VIDWLSELEPKEQIPNEKDEDGEVWLNPAIWQASIEFICQTPNRILKENDFVTQDSQNPGY